MSNTAVGILGILTPSLTLDAVVAVFFHKCKDSTILGRLLIGIRPVCLGMAIGVPLSIAKTTFFPETGVALGSIAIGAADWLLTQKYKLPVPMIILVSAAAGLILYGILPLSPSFKNILWR